MPAYPSTSRHDIGGNRQDQAEGSRCAHRTAEITTTSLALLY
jgi:hypothetical protein